MDLLAGLNEPQREAVLHVSGPLLIFAGAGSGKTRTLTHRVANLILHHRVPAGRILAVTFTNKAAREMRERLNQLVGAEANRIWMGTFHAMCAQMLRIHGHLIGLDPRFVIFDTDDSTRLMKEILRDADIDSDRYPAPRMLARISDAKNNLQSPDDLQSVAGSPYHRVVARVFKMYQERLKAAHALDFDDLLGEAVRLVTESEWAREHWSERFLHVMIDEFQDVNQAQLAWAKALASKHRNICVVGDDDQSIYKWRGADVKIILDFEKQYSDAHIIRLEQNYRSTQNILDAAHGVISNNFGRKAKRLWTQTQGGERIVLNGAANAQEEAAWVVRQIELLQREQHLKLSDFAILCRVNAQSRPFEEAFMRARVPLKLVGTQRFYDRKEIKDLVSYLKVLYNPNDNIALGRIINVPARGIGATTIEKLGMIARESGLSLRDVILNCGQEVLGRAINMKLEPLRRILITLQTDAENARSVVELLDKVLDRTNYYEFLRGDRTGNGNDRVANVEEFMSAASVFDSRMQDEDFGFSDESRDPESPMEGPPYLGLFLESSALESGTESGATGEDATVLMTLHSAKGLEFPIVFMPGMEQGLLPHSRALWGEQSGPDELEEERRLCYVGLTRAQQRIYLSYATQRTLHGRTESTQPSQFIDELPPQLIDRSGFARVGASSVSSYATTWESSGSSSSSRSAFAPAAAPRSSEPPRYRVGERLKHPTFGEGVVVNASPSGGAGEWVEVAFLSQDAGKKKLAVAFAPLEKVE
ncbi:MAG: ATP-dependent helicase UvrD/PcrA [Abditibacteriota bacterium]|nr:ATP-dependent helicase UvrD/PcrA [Abditibacteriota bacterium]